jgi:GNAT superfamily N-acetyltransferase
MTFTVERAAGDDLMWVERYLGEHWGAPLIVSRLVRHRADLLPALVAWEDGDPVGLLTYQLGGGELEIVAVEATEKRRGIGTALVEAAVGLATENGCDKIWLVTTNENVGGMAFYRGLGFAEVAVHRGAVDLARLLKPTIPKVRRGLEVHDEHEFERRLRPAQLNPALQDRIGSVLGSAVTQWRPVHGGYTPATRVVVTLRDGRTAYVKSPNSDEQGQWLRAELAQYARSLACMPRVLHGDDGAHPLLVLEDLSDAHWPPIWRKGDIEAVRAALAEVSAQPAGDLPRLAAKPSWHGQWESIKANPGAFLWLGVCTHKWFHDHVDAFIEAEATANLEGDRLSHCDVRSDNICLRDGRAYLIDWNWACAAHPDVDLAFWAPTLTAEGGPPPWETLPDAPGLAAKVAAFFASRAGLPTIPEAPRVRGIQHVQLVTALPWLAHCLGIEFDQG